MHIQLNIGILNMHTVALENKQKNDFIIYLIKLQFMHRKFP